MMRESGKKSNSSPNSRSRRSPILPNKRRRRTDTGVSCAIPISQLFSRKEILFIILLLVSFLSLLPILSTPQKIDEPEAATISAPASALGHPKGFSNSLLSQIILDYDTKEDRPLAASPMILSMKSTAKSCRKYHNEQWYIVMEFYEGLNNNRYALMTALYIAYLTSAILIEPKVPTRTTMCLLGKPCESYFNSTNWYLNQREFSYLYDVDYFRKQARSFGVQTLPELPSDCFRANQCINNNPMRMKLERTDTTGLFRKKEINAPSQCKGDDRHNRIGWCPNCNAGIVNIGYPQFAWAPKSDDEQIFWRKSLSLIRFSGSVRTAAQAIMKELKRKSSNWANTDFYSLHLRVEGDWPEGRMGAFDELARKMKLSGVPKGGIIFVATGIPPEDPRAMQFLNNPQVAALECKFVFFENLPERLIKEQLIRDGREMEFRAAVTYEICMFAKIHFGDFMSSFSYNLWIDRTGPTYNVNPTGHSEVVFSQLFGLEPQNEMLGLDVRWGLEAMVNYTMWQETKGR